MAELSDILPHAADFDPAAARLPEDPFFLAVPGKWCVALLNDANGQPVQLLCAKNLRATLRRRLTAAEGSTDAGGGEVAVQASKRVDYRTLVGSIRWARVDSELEMDLVYIEAARLAFPAHWRRLIPDRTAYFVRIDLDHAHPDFTRETGVEGGGRLFGPFADRAKADRWIEGVRDAFDLCRYRNVLAQSPTGRACAYKQMNKCPAPCDGSVPLDDYRAGVRRAVSDLVAPAAMVDRLNLEMRKHAVDLAFERAAKVKSRLATFTQLGEGAFAGVRPIESFRYLSVQPGGRKGTAKLWLITANAAVELLGIRDANVDAASVREAITRGEPLGTSPWPSDVLLGTVCHHLAGARSAGRFIAVDALNDAALATRLRDAMKIDAAKAGDETGEAVRETRLQL